ncbi:hypothetical protein GCM10010515_20520 [Streptomyces fructofermentans]|uniref:Uncharacterized protein n=1 Tax=Streptomyces fructofermentans TaxID=152141 RepID=A0A918K788_9ACTN|nr:hypothetical protein GCM10010515_20520 [Streptomyces fructofermentans]
MHATAFAVSFRSPCPEGPVMARVDPIGPGMGPDAGKGRRAQGGREAGCREGGAGREAGAGR